MTSTYLYDIQTRGNRPIYEFLYEQIRNDILKGKIKTGEQLPSKRALAQQLNISVATIEKTYHELSLEGYIAPRQRRGFFVEPLAKTTPFHANSGQINWFDSDDMEEDEPPLDLQTNHAGASLFPTSTWLKLLRKVISENPPDLFATVPYKGLLELRQALAHYLQRSRGMVVSPSQIIIGAGTEYLYSRIVQLLSSDTQFVFENPGYKKLAQIADNLSIQWSYCNVDRKGLKVNQLPSASHIAVHVSPANNFPGGFSMDLSRRKELLRWVNQKNDRLIIEDDYDSELRYEGNNLLPLFACSTNEKVIYLNSFSKTLMPSLRISYMILPKDLMQRYKETMSFYSCTVSGFEQRALAKFIEEGYFERHFTRLRNFYHKQRELVLAAFRSSELHEKIHILENNAGTHFLMYVDSPLSGNTLKQKAHSLGIKLALLSDYCFEEHSIAQNIIVINYANLLPETIEQTVEAFTYLFRS